MILFKPFHVMFKQMINCVFLSESQKAAHSDIVTWCEIIVFSHFAVLVSVTLYNNFH